MFFDQGCLQAIFFAGMLSHHRPTIIAKLSHCACFVFVLFMSTCMYMIPVESSVSSLLVKTVLDDIASNGTLRLHAKANMHSALRIAVFINVPYYGIAGARRRKPPSLIFSEQESSAGAACVTRMVSERRCLVCTCQYHAIPSADLLIPPRGSPVRLLYRVFFSFFPWPLLISTAPTSSNGRCPCESP